ncbi:hydroxysteroid 11-beta-dehydrogenase 1-like protein isoform X3 [Pteropus vampyrus]|uniref:Hydroxysteroid 11-beta-dehydrogenase 1-like protein isoform X3 n=1 Tax=Pteropus vampyrus TaxID=132908 RepID=A0A6P6D3M2_PTEVA|nr:hydroxysteroid 11-beta-dehydrogenase 1-like protein isoform X3 [Pteropus vampyrus]
MSRVGEGGIGPAVRCTPQADDPCPLPASLQGARALLTGASAGVGEELAYHYACLGSHLVLTAHAEALLQKVVGNCRKVGSPNVFYIAADMASPEVPERVVQFALDKLGGLDYLVLNHLGVAPAGTRARSAQAARWLMQVLRPPPVPPPLGSGFALPGRCFIPHIPDPTFTGVRFHFRSFRPHQTGHTFPEPPLKPSLFSSGNTLFVLSTQSRGIAQPLPQARRTVKLST